eukprot:4013870-Amphidinium_carterae.1
MSRLERGRGASAHRTTNKQWTGEGAVGWRGSTVIFSQLGKKLDTVAMGVVAGAGGQVSGAVEKMV